MGARLLRWPLSGSGHIAGGHLFSGEGCPVDNGHTSVVAYAGATIGHAATEDSLTSWMPGRSLTQCW